MTTSPKIDLTAIMKKNNKDNTQVNNDDKIEKNINKKINVNKNEEKIVKNPIKKEVIIENKKPKISINSIISSNPLLKDEKIVKKKEENTNGHITKKNELEKVTKNGDMFGNYKSDFEKKEKSILEKIKEEKNKIAEKLKKPKTRILLITSLIAITTLIIGGLFQLSPEKHSFQIYKTSIINNAQYIKTEYIDEKPLPWIQENIKIDKYDFVIEKQVNKKGVTISYKYKEIIYATLNEVNYILSIEVNQLRKIDEENEKNRIEQEKIKEEQKKEKEKQEKEKIVKDKIKKALENKFSEILKN